MNPIDAYTAALTEKQTLTEQLAWLDRQRVHRWRNTWIVARANLLAELVAVLEANKTSGIALWRSIKPAQQAASLETLRQALNKASAAEQAAIRQTLPELANQATRSFTRIVATQLPDPTWAHQLLRPVPAETISHIINRTVQQITVRHYQLDKTATETMKRTLTRGVLSGESPHEVARIMVRNCETVFNGGLVRATNIARTEMLDAYRETARASRIENEDVLAGWVWMSACDATTCPACWSMHGTRHPVDEPGPLDHHQGRCTALPVTKTWKELGFDGIDDINPDPANDPRFDATARFAALTETQQRTILGAKGFEAWQAGAYPRTAWAQRVTHTETINGITYTTWRDSIHTAKPDGGGLVERLRASPSGNRIEYRRKLGSAGTPTPPATATIDPVRIAPEGNPYLFFSEKEAKAADWLNETLGLPVKSVKEGAAKSPDAIISGINSTLEIKTLERATSGATYASIRSGRHQSQNICIDGRAVSLADIDARRGLMRGLGMYGDQLDTITIILPEGYIYWTHA